MSPPDNTIRTASTTQVIRTLGTWLAPHVRSLALAFGMMLACGVLFQAGPLLIRRAVDHDMAARDIQGLVLTVALFLGAQGLLAGLSYAERMVLERTGQSVL